MTGHMNSIDRRYYRLREAMGLSHTQARIPTKRERTAPPPPAPTTEQVECALSPMHGGKFYTRDFGFNYTVFQRLEDTMKYFRSLSPICKAAMLAYADKWLGDDQNYCDLVDGNKHRYTHHLSAALRDILSLPFLKHVDTDRYRFESSLKDYCNSSLERRFIDPSDIVFDLVREFGISCNGCDRIIVADDGELSRYVPARSRSMCDRLFVSWRFGVCSKCWKESGIQWAGTDEQTQSLVNDFVFQKRSGISQSQLNEYITKVVTVLAYLKNKHAAASLGMDERQIKILRSCVRNTNPKYIEPTGPVTKKWKAAYDAVRELGVNIP